MNLEVSALMKSYQNHLAIDGVSFRCAPEVKTLVLIGPSGSGKSTFLRLVGGLELPDHGKILFEGEALGTEEKTLLAHRRRLGFLFQSFNLFYHLSALQNLLLPLEKVHGFSAEEARQRALESLARFDLSKHAHKRPAQLSGGQQQRVALARALAISPRTLLLDEPTSALDPEMTAEVLDCIRELSLEGREIILSTHEMGFARAVADAVLFFHEGQLVEQGSAEEIFESPADERTQRFLARVMKY